MKNFFFRIVGLLISTLFNILLVSHYSKVLLVDGFGRYNFLLTYTSYFHLIISLGLDVVSMREISISKGEDCFGTMM